MSSTSSTTSPDDASKNITENIDTAETTRPLSASGDTRPLTMRLPTSDGVATDAVTSADSAPASSTSSPVWSAGTVTEQDRPQAPQDIKGSTLLWGAFLLLVGGLLIAAGLGLRFDFTTTAIACLAGLGGLLVVAALIPKKRRSSKP